jgi:class 3 adenylate cyclase/tetratricopeptide (TPR) repeat protein
MHCPRCQHIPPADAEFCPECGARLGLVCVHCAAENDAGHSFCKKCGQSLAGGPTAPHAYTPPHLAQKILTRRSAIEGERKQVTVLFCDLFDSTTLAEQLGPEAMHSLLNHFFELTLAEIHQYEGTINQFLGDGFMALFGAPLAYEDHARRAVLAALGIRRALGERHADFGVELAVRMGLNTGPVVVGKIGDNLRMDYTAIGDTTNVAARLQQLAEPGMILASESTRRLAQGYVRFETLDPLHLKGKAMPVPAFRVLGPGPRRSPLDRVGERALSPFVGRGAELDSLDRVLERAEQGRGQIASIVGEPGMGKSRLLLEFRQRLAGRPITFLEGRCLSYGSSIPYLLILDVLRNTCGVAETDTPDTTAGKVRAGLDDVGMDADAAVPYLLHLLGVKEGADSLPTLGPEVIQARTFEILRELTLRGSRRRPIIFALEDLHWIDRSSEEFLAWLAASVPEMPFLLLSTYRSGYQPPWMATPGAALITLEPLSRRDSLTVIESLLETSILSAPFAESILGKAEGNPFFLEELARAVAGQGGVAPTLAIPDTIQGVMAARIDRLSDDAKRLLQMTSVLGREFSARLLSRLWEGPGAFEPHLYQLVRQEFLREQPGTVEPAYLFGHALMQESVYASLLEARRRDYHLAAGIGLESLYAGRLYEAAELLAYHFGRSTDAARAVDYAIMAAEKAQRGWANSDALAHFDAALERLGSMPDTHANRLRRIDAVLRQAEVRFALGRHAEHIQALEGIRSLVDTAADPRRRATWCYWSGLMHSLTGGRSEVPIAYCLEAVTIADAGGFDDIRAYADSCLAHVYIATGDLRGAMASGERALAFFEARGDVWWACRTLWNLNTAALGLGQWRKGLQYGRRALENGQAVNDVRLKVVGWWRTGSAHIHGGEIEAGLRCCEEALALGPGPFDAAMVRCTRGYGLIKADDPATGTAELAEAVRWFEGAGLPYSRAWFGLWLAEGYLRQGDAGRARALLEGIVSTARESGYRRIEGLALRLLGDALAIEEPAVAANHLEAARRILDDIGARGELAKTLVTLASLRRVAGDRAEALRLLERALATFEELGSLDESPRVRAALADLEGQQPG